MKKVYVALSGGVDSAVSAALLQDQGYDVVGVHMKLWQPPIQMTSCSWQQDLEAAKRVADFLGIPFEVWDFTREYQAEVVEYLFAQYQAGRTPNPDVMCNRHIKFGLFYDRAIAKGADFVATGHYAQIVNRKQLTENGNQLGNQKKENRFQFSDFNTDFRFPKTDFCILRGKDPNKDQSYFLWAIERSKLPKILFPVGGMRKTQVREIARQIGLPNAHRKDSQGICFVGKIDLPEFLKLRIPARSGEVVTTSGQPVGQHQGAWYYTIGQRHGFGPPARWCGEPSAALYVSHKDIKTNRLVVAPRTDQALYATQATVGNLNWLVDGLGIENLKLAIQTRYRQKPIKARITKENKGGQRIKVPFAEPVWAVTPGQSMVFYGGNQVLGGGIIEQAN